MLRTDDVMQLVRDPSEAAILMNPQRTEILHALGEPDSAAGVARKLGLPRQQVNYHLRELERTGFVELVEERRRGNCVERVVRATATRYVLSPEVLGGLGEDPEKLRDHFSSGYLVAMAARTIRDLAQLRAGADAAGKKLPTMTLESDIRFASAEQRNAFAKDLSDAVARLIVKYHDADAPEGRSFRLLLGAYPSTDHPDPGVEQREGEP